MHRLTFFALLSAALVVSGCATYKPVPDGYAGPTATISDSSGSAGATTAQLFAVVEIDGNRVANSFTASAQASQGRGFSLSTRVVERAVPIRLMKLSLRGSDVTAAPIQAMAMQLAGRFYSVNGTVDFEPKPGARYTVKGELKAEGSSVWLEDEATGEVVTPKVSK